ncbi:MAG: hypothetical protein HY059_06040 [Proteobacteria bacterium]|nr:hypothetical protein [Pseudomonadota bacterium]
MPMHHFARAAFALLVAVPLAAQRNPDLAPYLMTDRAAEVALARSAAPTHVSDSATVLVLGRDGYVEGAHGTNGFTCLVARSFHADLDDAGFWNPRVRAPQCLNPPAVRTVLPEMLRRAEWIMHGVAPADIATRTERAYATHDFPMPEAGAMTFMLSAEQYLGDDGHWVPHLMFFFDKSIPAATWGTGGVTNTVIDGSAGDPHSPVRTLFVPVRRWSDGRTADATGHR